MSVPVFSSFGKTTNDFFTKGFPSAHKLEITTKTENGLTFINSAEKKARKDGTPYILGKFDCKYKHDKYGLETTETVDTDNVIKGDFSVNKLGLEGLKVIAKPQWGKAKEINAGFEFQNQKVSVASSLLFKADGETLLTASFAGRRGLFSAGVETNYFLKKSEGVAGLDSVRALVGYKTPNLEVLATAKNQWNVENKEGTITLQSANKLTFGASFEHKPGDKTTLHSQLEYDTTKPMPEAVALKFGGSHQLDAATTAQGKLDTEGKLTLHLAKQFCSTVKGTVSSEFDVFNLAGSEHKFAFGLAYKP